MVNSSPRRLGSFDVHPLIFWEVGQCGKDNLWLQNISRFLFWEKKKRKKKKATACFFGHWFFLIIVCVWQNAKLCNHKALVGVACCWWWKVAGLWLGWFNIAMGNAMPCHIAVAGLGSLVGWCRWLAKSHRNLVGVPIAFRFFCFKSKERINETRLFSRNPCKWLVPLCTSTDFHSSFAILRLWIDLLSFSRWRFNRLPSDADSQGPWRSFTSSLVVAFEGFSLFFRSKGIRKSGTLRNVCMLCWWQAHPAHRLELLWLVTVHVYLM